MAKRKKTARGPRLGATQRALGALRLRQQRLKAQQAALLRRSIREQRATAVVALRSARRANKPLLRVLAEGDSWMHYDCGLGVMHYVTWLMRGRAACLNIAASGDTMANMMKLPGRAELDRQLRSGVDGAPWDVLIFSGGGNDVAGDEFANWLLPFAGQTDPLAAIAQPRFGALLAQLSLLYGELGSRVHRYSPGTRVLLNGYDFAIPNGVGVPFAGPWLTPGFTARGYDVTSLAFRSQVVKLLLQQFAGMLGAVCAVFPFMQLMPTQGLLKRNEWANELHPTNGGFRRVAGVFVNALEQQLRAGVPAQAGVP